MEKSQRKIGVETALLGPEASLGKETVRTSIVEPRVPGSFRWEMGICLLLVALVAAVYGQTWGHAFVNYDDNLYVYDNSFVTHSPTFNGVLKVFFEKEWGLWIPLVTLSHLIDWQIFGSWAGGHHLTNVLLHLASSILLFFVLKQMTGRFWQSALVAALFAVHPLRVESVAWISERKDVLSGFFFMLSLAGYLRYVRQPGSWGCYAVVILIFALGLMSKPMLVTLPFLLLLLDYWPLNRLFQKGGTGISWRVVLEKIPLFLMAAALCAVTLSGTAEPDLIDPIPFSVRLGLAPVWLLIYLSQMIAPFGLAVVYPYPERWFPWWPPALALCVLLSLACFLLRKKHPYLWMGWLWNFGMLVPVLGLIQISRHSQADHYNYLPQIGLYIGGIWWLSAWVKTRPAFSSALKALAVVILLFLTVAAIRQTATWQDSTTLWNHTIRHTRENAVAHYNLGTAYLDAQRPLEAISEYREALRIDPSYVDAYNNLGLALVARGETEEGIYEYRKALGVKSDSIHPHFAAIHNNLGLALASRGEGTAAMAEYREALHIDASYVEARNNLGIELFRQGQVEAAMAEYKEALRIEPDFESAHYNLAEAFNKQGLKDKAFFHLKRVLAINPSNAKAHNNLGALLYEQRKTEEAVAEYREALRLAPGYAGSRYNLGKIFLEQGQFDRAIKEFREALRVDPKYAAAYTLLGDCLLKKGLIPEAIQQYQQAYELRPDDPSCQNDLAWVLATVPELSLRDGNRALHLATMANQSTGGKVAILLRTLAAAFAQAGNFPKAVATIRTALQLDQDQDPLRKDLMHDLQLYQAGQSYPQKSN